MGLKCLLGHDYSAPEIERERVEDGDEVVTTLREVQTCARCGETRVVSENTEVTTMARLTAEAETVDESATRTETLSGDPSPDELSTNDTPTTDPSAVERSADQPAATEPSMATPEEPAASGDSQAPTATPETDEGVEFIEETASDASASRSVTADPTTDEGATADSTTDDQMDSADDRADPADDGAEILESESAVGGEDGSPTATGGTDRGDGRERGAWPSVDAPAEAPAETDGEHRSWPTHDAEDEGYDASASSRSSGSGDEAVAYVGGPAAEAPTTVRSDTATGLERSREQRAASAEETRLRGPTEYYCPACGMTTDTEGSSLRAGDVCPECRGGYVAERSQ